jgi:hypothetical protein
VLIFVWGAVSFVLFRAFLHQEKLQRLAALLQLRLLAAGIQELWALVMQ